MTSPTDASDYTSPHWDRAALVLIDVQNDFVDGAASVPGTRAALPAMARLLAAFRAAHRPVVHVVRLYVPGGSDVDPLRRSAIESGIRIAAPGTAGADVAASLLSVPLDAECLLDDRLQQVGDDEVVLFKPRWSAFYRTSLDEHLRGRGVDTVVVAGCNLPNCPRATLFDATERDFRAVVVADATSQATERRLDDLRLIGVEVRRTAQVEAALAENAVAPNP
ncbi:Isochorismatase hydrolase OS=Tsukamurella paurometabola (strain ATCC 8368 / DSM / CCUG 35730/ CIP 100753 / JCM 10117 / KCTC 9821 / NBRC 16120 / NCIMB 702349/ NCTC 13040) OX=521096 GN=Tpau_2022 PE=4 SV=1 [Tsukamurella paurometabola]|uniref:Isochorismatase hydrolase n=1 Tax=Tsukamurella paurometabola (strain ATCC 8368 / DSM 20162 / CCUG 35730 / CIP 100753 / JCM 10117 / KCTC 9821 / NBRC 16120 / NCIMB 702349 / NCTC 13040) TaxID=521096 RepID=D5UNR6_TSUPD|nr:isochorismatase family cysteine hydrolase [Tsukamurella paurometabola]ADG78634.1 isochorismatase hydrolase [Tsukamurella paurometabola DSM 20162]SUP32506.1 Peroxyureidoacrylate/ureidoacrylate amidohydrolase RutB [Tsukamurella paurometabola]